jgi:hypothetical protein
MTSADNAISNAVSVVSAAQLSTWNAVSNEISVRAAASAALETHINTVSNAVSVVSNAVSVVSAAQLSTWNAVSNEISARAAASAALETHINTVSNAVSIVSAQLVSVDTKLSNAISAVSNAVSVVSAAQLSTWNAVSNEISVRAAASAALESHINTVSNAVSVVSAQLVSVDTKLSNAVSAVSNAVSVVSAAQLSTWNRVSALLTSSTTFSGATYTFSGNIAGNTNGFTIGYLNIPQVSFSANSTLALTDAGKHYYSTSSSSLSLTIPNNASTSFAVGSAINLVNQGTGNITITQGSGVTLYLAGNSTSGNRIVTSYGLATMQKVATDTWFVVGVGLV